MKTAMTLTAVAALAGLSAAAFTQGVETQDSSLVLQTVEGKPFYLASTLLGSSLVLEDGQVQIKDLLLDDTGQLQAVVVSNPGFLGADAAIAADLVYLAGQPGDEILRTDVARADFDLLRAGGGYEPIGLNWASEYDNARSVSALMGQAISVNADTPPIAIDDLEISEGGAVLAVHFESRGWHSFSDMDGRIPVNAVQLDYDQPQGWTVAANVNEAQLNALAGRDTTLFLSAAPAS